MIGNGPTLFTTTCCNAPTPQNVWAPEIVNARFGFTTMDVVRGSGLHAFALVGVIVKVTVWAEDVVLTNGPEIGIDPPVPLFAMPVTLVVLSLIQLKVVPATFAPKLMADMEPPEQIVAFGLVTVVVKTGFTVTVILAPQPPAEEEIL